MQPSMFHQESRPICTVQSPLTALRLCRFCVSFAHFLKNNTVRLCVGACSSFLLLLLFSRLCCCFFFLVFAAALLTVLSCSCGRYSCVRLIRHICRWCSSRRRGLVLWWLWTFLGGCSVARRCECVKEHRVLLLMFHHRVCGCCLFRLDSYNARWNVVEGGYECSLTSSVCIVVMLLLYLSSSWLDYVVNVD